MARYFAAHPIRGGRIVEGETEWIGVCEHGTTCTYGVAHPSLQVAVDAVEGHRQREHPPTLEEQLRQMTGGT